MKKLKFDFEHLWVFFLLVVVLTIYSKVLFAKEARTLELDDKKIGKIFVSYGKSTILNFPSKPSKVILGNRGAFSLEYIESDLAIAALHSNVTSNLFVYVQGRRFALDLVAQSKNSDEVVIIRDVKVKAK